MAYTSSGPRCDVCAEYILLEDVYRFEVTWIKGLLIAHEKCHGECANALAEGNAGIDKLPEGPLKKALLKYAEEIEEHGGV